MDTNTPIDSAASAANPAQKWPWMRSLIHPRTGLEYFSLSALQAVLMVGGIFGLRSLILSQRRLPTWVPHVVTVGVPIGVVLATHSLAAANFHRTVVGSLDDNDIADITTLDEAKAKIKQLSTEFATEKSNHDDLTREVDIALKKLDGNVDENLLGEISQALMTESKIPGYVSRFATAVNKLNPFGKAQVV